MRRKGRDARGNVLLPGYVDLQEIGGSAFATVFRATEAETKRPVAVKVLKVDAVHSSLIEAFHREIEALAAVSHHPHIVTLYRPSTTSDGRPVLVLELCRESLADRIRDTGPLTAEEVTDVGVKIAGALETAHRNGFLHLDVKLPNILVTHFGQPALADFGVAALQASAQMTAGVHVAPEMLEGRHLSPVTDVYGLASTMYEALTGRAPFAPYGHEAPASVILRILRDPVPPLRAEHIPLGLADLLEAAMAKETEGRPRSAAEFAHALGAVRAEQGWPDTPFVAWGETHPSGGTGSRSVAGVPPLLPPSSGAGTDIPPATPRPAAPTAEPAPAPAPGRPPSVTRPEPAPRNVIAPVGAERGDRAAPAAPLTPVAPVAPSAPAPRPVFLDPEPVAESEGLRPLRPRPEPPVAPTGPTQGERPSRGYAVLSVAAVAVAVLVIIAAALVVAGVL